MLSEKAKKALEIAMASKKLGDEVVSAIDDAAAGIVPANSISNSELGTDVKVGSLAALTTTVKTDAVSAINEVDSHADSAQADATQALADAATAEADAQTGISDAAAAQSTANAAIPKTNASANLAGAAPLQADMVAALGAAAEKAGVVAVLTDSSDATKVYLCASNGVSWCQSAIAVGA